MFLSSCLVSGNIVHPAMVNQVTTTLGRNNNSSRFGKYNRVFFDETGTLVDASVSWKLMECQRHPVLQTDDLNGF